MSVLQGECEALLGERIVVLCDENTAAYCLPVLTKHLKYSNVLAEIVVKPGEASKSLDMASVIWRRLTDLGFTRNDVLICLGGGTITDLGGFAASLYLRGIPFVHIPTTLLGMVDAAIGGKTAVDLGAVKNRIGNVVFPAFTVCDTVFLETLTDDAWMDGMAESLKHAIIGNRDLWLSLTATQNVRKTILENLQKIQSVKLNVIDSDPYEKGYRMILNFGHSIGHAVESCALESDFGLMSHGRAVAIGMVIESMIANRLGILSDAECIEISEGISKYFGQQKLSWLSTDRIFHFLRLDKKNTSNSIRMSLPERIGFCRTGVEVSEELILSVMTAYVKHP